MISTSYEVKVPNLGEGVRYVTVRNILLKDGDWVDEDAGLIEVETDKSVVEIPSPVSGYIGGIECKPGDVLPVGVKLLVVGPKAHVQLNHISGGNGGQIRKGSALKNKAASIITQSNRTIRQSPQQMALVSRMQHSASVVVPAMVEREIIWDHIDAIKKHFRSCGAGMVPSGLEIICWALASSMHKFEKFKSKIDADGILSLSEKASIGVAVSANGDELSHNVFSCDAGIDIVDVSLSLRKNMGAGYHSVSVSDMSSFGVTRAIPIVVYPSVATVFIGSPQDTWKKNGWARAACVAISFDHRVMNGAYVASFLRDFERNIDKLRVSLVG